MSLLAIIAAAEHIRLEKAYTRYGGQDMLPRLNMAINLTKEAKWPRRLIKRLEAIRAALQGGLADRRNLFVHGVHAAGNAPGEVRLTMVRWKGKKRHQYVTLVDALDLANKLAILAQEIHSIDRDYGVWKFGSHYEEDRGEQIRQTKAATRFIRAHNVKRAIKLLLANLKPW